MRLAIVVLPLLVAALAVAASASAEATPADVVVDVAADGSITYDGRQGLLELASFTPGEGLVWNLSVPDDYVVVEVRVHGAFDVERPKQLVPRLDDKYYVAVAFDPTEVEAPAHVVKVSGDGDDVVQRIGIPGPAWGKLRLVRDVEAPGFHVDAPTNVTQVSFLVNAATTEPALATLAVRPSGSADDAVLHPTPNPSYYQRFPVQGLDADTRYTFTITFADWAGNEATSDEMTVRTLSTPFVPPPNVTVVSPLPDATVADAVDVRVALDGNGSALDPATLRVYLDLQQRAEEFAIVDGVLAFRLVDLDPGLHRLTVEVENVLGGEGAATWLFTVAPAATPLPILAAVGALLVAARRR